MQLANFFQVKEHVPEVSVLSGMGMEGRVFWTQANKHVLWGWKRDTGRNSRTVYFSGDLVLKESVVALQRSFFFYRHRTDRHSVSALSAMLSEACAQFSGYGFRPCFSIDRPNDDYPTLTFGLGESTAADADRVTRLLRRRPRKAWQSGEKPAETPLSQMSADLFPCDLYSGSGVSYEAGLPTLCEMHDRFCLDNSAALSFTHGSSDQLPAWLAKRPIETIRSFCDVHTRALIASPTPALRKIAALYSAGKIGKVFSDNVDNLMCKVQIPFERTRGSGVFNERYNACFTSPVLLVVGVAADRRQIIRQARARRMRVVVVDPCARVSHGVQHLNFLRRSDTFFRTTANEFFCAAVERCFGSSHG